MGLGGAGCNLVNRLCERPPAGVELVLANTDAQALLTSRKGPKVVFLGEGATRGLGAGADYQLGRKAAEQSNARLDELFQGVDMVFLTAGMGGGTGTGAAPIAARAARRAGALVVAVVTTPFEFEGHRRCRVAREGVAHLQDEVDTLLVLPNEKLLSIDTGTHPLDESFQIVDQVLCDAVRGMTEIVTMPGIINLDFADVRAVLANSGRAIFGMATATSAQRAVELALSNPLVGGSPDGAAGCLLNITAGPDITLQDFSAACALLQESASPDAMVLCGYVQDDSMHGRARATVVATRVTPADVVSRPSVLMVNSADDLLPVRDSERRPLTNAALPVTELTGVHSGGYDRRHPLDSDEITFAPSHRGLTPRESRTPAPVSAGPSGSPRAGLVRKQMSGPANNASAETDRKNKWMDLPAIWRRARGKDEAAQ
jgi:cell division protein FtsZ